MVTAKLPSARSMPWPLRLAFGSPLLILLLAVADEAIVMIMLPAIARDLGDLDTLFGIITGYLVGNMISLPVWSRLADRFGRVRTYQAAIAIFVLGSLCCAMSQNPIELISARILEGLGAAGPITAYYIIKAHTYPQDRARYKGATGALIGFFLGARLILASIGGPAVGGWAADQQLWRWVFVINVPTGVAAAVALALAPLQPAPRSNRSFDGAGALLLGLSAAGVALLVTLAGTAQPWMTPTSLLLVLATTVALIALVCVERRTVDPVLPLRLFRNRMLTLSAAISFLALFALAGVALFVSLYLQLLLGATAQFAGITLGQMMLMSEYGIFIIRPYINRSRHYKGVFLAGAAFLTGSLWLLSQISVEDRVFTWEFVLWGIGLGGGCLVQLAAIAGLHDVAAEDRKTAGYMIRMSQVTGSALGVAAFGALFARRFAQGLETNLRLISGEQYVRVLLSRGALRSFPRHMPVPVLHALGSALDAAFVLAIPAVVLAFALSLLLPNVHIRLEVNSLREPSQPGSEQSGASAAS